MPLPDSPQTQDEAARAARHAGLIGVRDDTWVEQGCRFEGILVDEISTDELALGLGERAVSIEYPFHVVGPRLESRQQVAMAALEILQHLGQLTAGRLGIERLDPVNDAIHPRFVRLVLLPRFG